MAGDDAVPVPVANPYRAALAQAAAQARAQRTTAVSALDDAVSAMQSEAWVSSVADQFFAGLRSARADVQAGCDGVVANLDEAHDRQPAHVEQGAWQLHWQVML